MILQLLRRALMPIALLLAAHKKLGLASTSKASKMVRIFCLCARHPCRRILQSTSRVSQLQKVGTPNYFGSASQAPSDTVLLNYEVTVRLKFSTEQ